MEIPTSQLIDHVASLSAAFKISIVFERQRKREEAMALLFKEDFESTCWRLASGIRYPRCVFARPIEDETGYIVVMHEMGHHLAPNGFLKKDPPKPGAHPREWFEFWAAKLVTEEAAWTWARYYVEQRFQWTAAMEQVYAYAFASYEKARRTGQ